MNTYRLAAAAASLTLLGISVRASGQFLGTADSFAVLAGSTVTNTGSSVINGNLGVWPGNTATGIPPGIVNGVIHLGDSVAKNAQGDTTTAYNDLAGLAPTENLTGQDLGGLTLVPGVYFFASSAQLTGALTLNTEGDPNARFVFQIGSTLTTASNSSVDFINGGGKCNVYWQVGSSATLGTGTDFAGHILALTSITMNTDAEIVDGSALARNGAVTLQSNTISLCPSSTPEPSTTALMFGSTGFGMLIAFRRRKASHA